MAEDTLSNKEVVVQPDTTEGKISREQSGNGLQDKTSSKLRAEGREV